MAKRTYTGYQPVSKRNANDMVDICYVTSLNVLERLLVVIHANFIFVLLSILLGFHRPQKTRIISFINVMKTVKQCFCECKL